MENVHPIYNYAVHMKNQNDCDLAKKLCKKYSLPIWDRSDAFDYAGSESYLFCYDNNDGGGNINEYDFYVDRLSESELEEKGLNIVSIEQFEELAMELIPEYESVEDILHKLREINYVINKPNS